MNLALKEKWEEALRAYANVAPLPTYGTPERQAWDQEVQRLRAGMADAQARWLASLTDEDIKDAVLEYLNDQAKLSTVGQVVFGVAVSFGSSVYGDGAVEDTLRPRVQKALNSLAGGRIQWIKAGDVRRNRPYGAKRTTKLWGTTEHFVRMQEADKAAAEAADMRKAKADEVKAAAEAAGVPIVWTDGVSVILSVAAFQELLNQKERV